MEILRQREVLVFETKVFGFERDRILGGHKIKGIFEERCVDSGFDWYCGQYQATSDRSRLCDQGIASSDHEGLTLVSSYPSGLHTIKLERYREG